LSEGGRGREGRWRGGGKGGGRRSECMRVWFRSTQTHTHTHIHARVCRCAQVRMYPASPHPSSLARTHCLLHMLYTTHAVHTVRLPAGICVRPASVTKYVTRPFATARFSISSISTPVGQLTHTFFCPSCSHCAEREREAARGEERACARGRQRRRGTRAHEREREESARARGSNRGRT
jgi:hypothetical protein